MRRWSWMIFMLYAAQPAALALAQPTPTGDADAQTADDGASRDDEARARFEAGRIAYAGSRYAEALAEFEVSYELSGRPELLYNMGQCLDRLRRDADAIEIFARYLAALPEAANHVEVETRLAVLRAAVREREQSIVTVAPEVLTDAPPAPAAGVETEWWFWTAIGGGALVVGAIIAAVAVTTSGTSTDPLHPGDVGPGGIVVALEGP